MSLAAAGGVVGLFVGLGMVAAVDRLLGMPTALTAGMMVMAFLCAVGVGVIFGLFPAIRAGRLNPVEALHYE